VTSTPTPSVDELAVAAANQAFYDAFETRDLDVMAEVWDRSERASITHPGWPTLHGWAKVAASWDAIFRGTPYIQFFLTGVRVHVEGDAAWVTLDESILQAYRGDPDSGTVEPSAGSTVAATNVFVRRDGRWLMVNHHGSPVAGPVGGLDEP
jgi:ketosteroid isomerase-like protein